MAPARARRRRWSSRRRSRRSIADTRTVSVEDVRAVALPALRHRILLNFEGEADEVSTDAMVQELLTHVSTA